MPAPSAALFCGPKNFDEYMKRIIKALKTQNHNNGSIIPSIYLRDPIEYFFCIFGNRTAGKEGRRVRRTLVEYLSLNGVDIYYSLFYQ